jgi:UDP-N-acetylglucosamine diphosphorylase/glucosamine-1-phosphate N-acetyltransferase
MFKLFLNEEGITESFYPLTLTRSFNDLKVGIFSIRERWERMALHQNIELECLTKIGNEKVGVKSIPANYIPPVSLSLKVFFNETIPLEQLGFKKVNYLWDLIALNEWLIKNDIGLVKDQKNDKGLAKINGDFPVLVGSNVKLENCIINLQDGPVFIDNNVHIMEGALLRGPISIGNGTVIKMGALIYGGTTIGPNCSIGGELKNSTIQGHTNKAHHGYIGNSYIGEWCNLGAGTSCSNVKNTLGDIKVWDMSTKEFIYAGNRVGIYMGDHVKTAIHTGFNSGAVIGPFSNIFEFEGLTHKFIDCFSWGGKSNTKYKIDNLLTEINRWMTLKNIDFTTDNQEKIRTLYHKMK